MCCSELCGQRLRSALGEKDEGAQLSKCCISQKTFFIITAVVGTILLSIGMLAFTGHLIPMGDSPVVFQKINSITNIVAHKLSADPFTLTLLTASFGAGLTFVGVGGVLVVCREKFSDYSPSAPKDNKNTPESEENSQKNEEKEPSTGLSEKE
jgi:hypothetical protein